MGFLKNYLKDKQFQDNIVCLSDEAEPSYISSGNFAFNSILSGNVFNGIPDNATVCLAGRSNVGKTLFLAYLIKYALEMGYDDVLIFDSEKSVKKNYYERVIGDVSKIYRYPVSEIMEFRNRIFEVVTKYKTDNPNGKLFVGLDSLSMLISAKDLADIEKDKDAAEQGAAAKAMNNSLKVACSLSSKYNFPFVYTNHVYESIGDMFATRPKLSGGGKTLYVSDIVIFVDKYSLKEEQEDVFGKERKEVTGNRFKLVCLKNRYYKEELPIEIASRYDETINPYSGLLDFAIRSGVLENKPRGYLVTATGKTVYDSDLYTPEIFTKEALDKINDWLSKNGYSSLSDVLNSDVAKAVQEVGVTDEEEEKEQRSKKKQ